MPLKIRWNQANDLKYTINISWVSFVESKIHHGKFHAQCMNNPKYIMEHHMGTIGTLKNAAHMQHEHFG